MTGTMKLNLPRLDVRPAVGKVADAMSLKWDEAKQQYDRFWRRLTIEWGPGFRSLDELAAAAQHQGECEMKFTDSLGREWTLCPTVGHLKPLRELGFDLPKLFREDSSLGDVLFADPEKLVAAFWLLVENQADRLNVTPESFADGFDGATLEAAVTELVMAAFALLRGSKAAEQARPKILAALAKADEAVAAAISSKLD